MHHSLNAWRRIRFEPGPDLKLFRARFDYMQNPRNGKTERMIILESNDSVNVVALTPTQEMLFVRQYRFGIGQETLELPGGIVDDGEAPAQAAERELREETGFGGLEWTPLGKVASNPVFMDSWIHHYLVREARPAYEIKLDEGEDVAVVTLPLEEVRRRLWAGDFLHPHTVSGLVAFFARWEQG